MIDVKVCSRGLRLVQEAHGRYSHSIPWCVSSEERQMYTAHKQTSDNMAPAWSSSFLITPSFSSVTFS